MNKEYENKLEKIAVDYHNGQLQDMWIEKAGQDFEWPWIQSKIPDAGNILDLGYGDGHSFQNLKILTTHRDLQVTVIEGAKSLVEIAKKNANSNFDIVHDFFETFQTGSRFDVIIASHVLEHVDNPVELLLHLKKFLTTNGMILGIVPNSESIHRRLAVILKLQDSLDSLSQRDFLVGHQRVYSLRSLTADIESSGLKLVESRGFFMKPFSNSQLIPFGPEIVGSLLAVSEELPVEICANIGFVCQLDFKDHYSE